MRIPPRTLNPPGAGAPTGPAILAATLVLVAVGCHRQEHATRVVLRTEPIGPGVFQRLVIEVRPRGADATCAACRRELSAEELSVSGQITFSVVSPDAPPVVRVSLSRGRGEGVRPASSLEVIGTFDDPAADEVVVTLPFRDTGAPRGTWASPVALLEGHALGEAPPRDAPCSGADDAAQVCVPGGLFWMGDPTLDLLGGVNREGTEERLIVLSPFWLDAREVTVRDFRAADLATFFVPVRRNKKEPSCTYTESEGDAEDLPVTCITWERADAYCQARGARLPTEAELEHVQGARRSRRHVWGDAPVACSDAVVGDARCGRSAPSIAGSTSRDRLAIGDRTLVDLVGNVSEWTADRWNSTRERCFAAAVLVDPRCDLDSELEPGLRAVKGQAFSFDLSYVGAAFRIGAHGDTDYGEALGFRCARGGPP